MPALGRRALTTPVATLTPWVVAYLAVGGVSLLTQTAAGALPLYPPLAVAVLMMWRLGLRVWPVMLAADAVVSLTQFGPSEGWFLLATCVTTIEAVTLVWLLRRFDFDPAFGAVRDVLLLAVATAAMAVLGATLGTAVSWVQWQFFGDSDALVSRGWFDVWQMWTLGDFTGSLTFLPLLLLLPVRWWRPAGVRAVLQDRTSRRAALPVLVAVVAAGAAFDPALSTSHQLARAAEFLVVIPVVYVAVTTSLRVTVVAIAVVDVAALVGVRAHGPWLDATAAARALVPVQGFIAAVTFCALTASTLLRHERRSRATLESLLAGSPVGITSIDLDGRVRSWNRACAEMFGWSAAEVLGRPVPVVPAEGEPGFRERVRRVAFGERLSGEEVEYVDRDGRRKVTRLSAGPQRDADGRVVGSIAIFEDQAELQARTRERDQLAAAIEEAAQGVLMLDADCVITYANRAVEVLTGYTREELVGGTTEMFRSGRHSEEFYSAMWEVPRSGQPWTGTVVDRRKDGSLVEIQLGVSPIRGGTGAVTGFVALQRDLSRERALQRDLNLEVERRRSVAAAVSDIRQEPHAEDTGASIAAALARLPMVDAAAVAQIRSDGAVVPLAAAAFGAQVASVGPPLGEAAASTILSRCAHGEPWTRAEHVDLGLFGFAVDGTDGWTASAYAPVTWADRVVGVLVCATRAEDGAPYLQELTGSLATVATHAGAVLGPQMLERDDRDSAAARTLQVLEHGSFMPVFQPIVALDGDEVVGWEALTRFHNGRSPLDVFADARTCMRHADLEIACIRAALAGSAALPGHHWLSLNVSPDVLPDPRLQGALRSSSRSLVVEITETVEVSDYAALRAQIEALRPGVRLAVDDAGAGYASLRHIIEMGPELVKLDLALIRGIDADPVRQAMLAGIGHYATQTGATLLAEGVETAAEAATLRGLGVPLAQGYLFGRPLPADDAVGGQSG